MLKWSFWVAPLILTLFASVPNGADPSAHGGISPLRAESDKSETTLRQEFELNRSKVDFANETIAEFRFREDVLDCRKPEVPIPQEADHEGKLDLVHVAYSSNARQFPGILLSITSLARHTKNPDMIVIHMIVSDEDRESARELERCYYRGFDERRALPKLVLHTLHPLGFSLGSIGHRWRPDLLAQPHTFVRFYLHEYLPLAPRVIWLDSDTIVRADLTPLYRMKMQHPIAAALESGQKKKGRLFLAKKWLNQSNESLEWNTGVVVFDLDRWRSENITAECEMWTIRVRGVAGDQIAMNLALYDRIDTITDWRWNLRGWNSMRPPWFCLEPAKILHWSGNPEFTKKTWEIGTNPSERHRWGYELLEPYILNPACRLNGTITSALAAEL